MDTYSFHVMRGAVQRQASPGRRDELDELGKVYKQRLAESGVLSEPDVVATDDENELISATCYYTDDLDPGQVVAELERLWSEQLSHPFWSAHTIQTTDAEVALEGATRFGVDGPYVTVRLAARGAAIPAQRSAS